MKKVYFSLIILGLIVALPASAHVFKTDGQITVLMHTDPDDDVVASQPATMFFSVFDQDNKFEVSNCDCSVSVSENQKLLLNKPLLPDTSGPTIFSYEMPFVFEKEDNYMVIVTGNPKMPGQFQPFSTQYTLNVNQAPPPTNPPANADSWVDGIIAVLSIAGILALMIRHRISYNE